MKRKLIYIAIIVGFIFLTGGVKITYEIDIYHDPEGEENLKYSGQEVDYRLSEIRIFGFCYKIMDGTTKTNVGWEFNPSLKIFSISKNINFVEWYKIKKGGEND